MKYLIYTLKTSYQSMNSPIFIYYLRVHVLQFAEEYPQIQYKN